MINIPLTCSVYLVMKLVSNAYRTPINVPPMETTKNDAIARPTFKKKVFKFYLRPYIFLIFIFASR